MTSQLGNETSLFDNSQTGPSYIDSVGGKNASTVNGGVSFNPSLEFIEYDGVNDDCRWESGAGLLNMSADNSLYLVWSFPNDISGTTQSLMGGLIGNNLPFITFFDTVPNPDSLRYSSGVGSDTLIVGVQPNDPVKIATMRGYDDSLNLGVFAWETTAGLKGSGNYTHSAIQPENGTYTLGRNKGGYANIRIHGNFGVYAGIFVNEADCVDTVAALIDLLPISGLISEDTRRRDYYARGRRA